MGGLFDALRKGVFACRVDYVVELAQPALVLVRLTLLYLLVFGLEVGFYSRGELAVACPVFLDNR